MSKAAELAALIGSQTALSNRNLVINGAMQVAQRGTSASVSDGSNEGYQTLDRFKFDYGNNAGGVATISQDTTVPSGYGFSNSYKVDVTTADTSLASTHQIFFRTILEAQDIRNSGWNYTSTSSFITLSFWAKSSKAGTYNIAFRASDVGALYYLVEYTLVADTWKKVTATIPGDSSLVFNDDNGNGLEIRWNLALGTDRNDGTANQWNSVSSNNAGTSNQVNFFDSTDNNFFLTGVQLEVGEQATPFEHRSFGDELARCKRYYEKTYPYANAPGTTAVYGSIWGIAAVGFDEETSGQRQLVQTWKVEKRANPTLTIYDNVGNSGKVTTTDHGGTQTNNRTVGLAFAGTSMYGAGPQNGAYAGLQFFCEGDAEL